MRFRAPVCALLLCASASAAHGDVLLHDRSADAPGAAQGSPSCAEAHTLFFGSFLVTAWEQQSGASREFNVSLAPLPLGSGSVVDHGPPPAPAGFLWFGDPIVRAPRPLPQQNGVFYLFGQIRSTGVAPYTYGLGFVRGNAGVGASVSWGTPQVVETFGTHTVNQRYVNALSMDVDPGSQVVQVGYSNTRPDFALPSKSLWRRTSPNGGVSWSAPAMMGNDSTIAGASVVVLCGPSAGQVTYLWQEFPNGVRMTRCRRSTDHGVTVGPIENVALAAHSFQTAPHGSGAPAFPAMTIDRTGVPGAPELVLMLSTEIAHSGIGYPDIAAAPGYSEIELNDSPAASNLPGAPGVVLRGVSGGGDVDYFAFDLGAGAPVMAWMDSSGASRLLGYGWLGPDGMSSLTSGTFVPGSSVRMGFVAPAAGRYYLRFAAVGSGSGYRVRTTSAATPATGARDQHDVFCTGTRASLPWAPLVNASAAAGLTAGFDEGGVSLASNLDGYLYASWFDWQAVPAQEVARRVMTRSPDGGLTWETPQVISAANSTWLTASGTTAPTMIGPWSAGTTDGTDIHDVWVDARNGDPDLYGVTLHRAMQIAAVDPDSLAVHPGQVVRVDPQVLNLDPHFGWDVRLGASASRPWSLSTSNGLLGAGETRALPYEFTIPDTAAPGPVTLFINAHSNLPPYTFYHSAPVTLEVQAITGAPEGGSPLSLSPIVPNPSRASAAIAFTLFRGGPARVTLHGVDGRRVRVLVDGELPAGTHTLRWDGLDHRGGRVPPGVYLVRVEAAGRVIVRRMSWLR